MSPLCEGSHVRTHQENVRNIHSERVGVLRTSQTPPTDAWLKRTNRIEISQDVKMCNTHEKHRRRCTFVLNIQHIQELLSQGLTAELMCRQHKHDFHCEIENVLLPAPFIPMFWTFSRLCKHVWPGHSSTEERRLTNTTGVCLRNGNNHV